MKHQHKKGFTILEVSLFLALSGFLMVGLIVGTNLSIARQRYNDSVNTIAEYLRGVYADVINVSNDKLPVADSASEKGPGRTTNAVYGKLVTFGEVAGDNTVYSYDVAGIAVSSSAVGGSSVIDIIASSTVDANIIYSENCNYGSTCKNTFYSKNSFIIPWGANLENSDKSEFHGAVLVVRSPVTGSVRTYTYTYASDRDVISFHDISDGDTTARERFKNLLTLMKTTVSDFDMCLDSDDNNYGDRRDIRIALHANNSSGVMLVELNGEDSKCRGR